MTGVDTPSPFKMRKVHHAHKSLLKIPKRLEVPERAPELKDSVGAPATCSCKKLSMISI